MSHQAELQMEINDLDCLSKAAEEVNCELVLNASEYKTYSGKEHCNHLIRVKDNKKAFQIGVLQTYEDKYALRTDFYMGGHGLQDAVGADACLLNQAYMAAVFEKNLPFGYTVNRLTLPDGQLVLEGN